MDRLRLQIIFSRKIDELCKSISNKNSRIIKDVLILRNINNLKQALNRLDQEIARGKISDEGKSKILKLIQDRMLRHYMNDFIASYEKNNNKYLDTVLCNRISSCLQDYQAVLDKYEIDDCYLVEKVIKEYSARELDEILSKFLFTFGLIGDEVYRILLYSNYERVNDVFSLLNKYCLNMDSLADTVGLIFKLCNLSDDSFNIFRCNVEFLRTCGISFEIDNFTSEKLFINDKIMNNCDILVSYDLFKEIIGIKDTHLLFDILSIDGLEEKIDVILEMGCYKFLKNNLFSLNNDYTRRLKVLKCIGTPVVDQETYNITMSTNNFIVDDKDFDLEMYSSVDIHDNVRLNIKFEDLEQFRCSENNLLYNIGGVLVSVNKVKRILDEGKDIYTSITSGLILSDDEYSSIMDVLQPLQYKKK